MENGGVIELCIAVPKVGEQNRYTIASIGTVFTVPAGESLPDMKFKYPGIIAKSDSSDPLGKAPSDTKWASTYFRANAIHRADWGLFGIKQDGTEELINGYGHTSSWGGSESMAIAVTDDFTRIKVIFSHGDSLDEIGEDWSFGDYIWEVVSGDPGVSSNPPPPGVDPSGPGGGDGTYDDTSDPIPFPDVPVLSAVSTGMMSLYSPDISQLRALAEYLWSDEFNLDTFKKLFADPMEVIIGLSMVPVQPVISGTRNIAVGFVDTGVACNYVGNQYVTVDCGTLDIKEFFGTALDYSPYTKFSIYLPFIGTKELKTDDIMGKTIAVRYTVDILSGACTAHIKCGESVMYQYSGSCASTIPVTSQNWSQLITSIIQLAGAGIATAMSGGAAAPLLPAAANTVLSAKPTIQRAGAVSGAAGFLGIQYPYLIWEHPRQSLPTGYNKFVGYPSNITQELSALTGFTQIESIHLENVPATQNELMEIESLLKEGVIF